MILGIEKELAIFLQAIITGNLLYLVYSAIRIVRRIIIHNIFFVSVEDLIFWIGAGLYIFGEIEKTSDGIIRWYFVVGVVLGTLLTNSVFQSIQKKHIAKTKKTS